MRKTTASGVPPVPVALAFGIAAEGNSLVGDEGRGQEEAGEAQLVRLGVRNLDHHRGVVVVPLQLGHHRSLHGHVSVAIPDGHHGRVAIAGEVDAGAAQGDGIVDLQDFLLRRSVRVLLGGYRG